MLVLMAFSAEATAGINEIHPKANIDINIYLLKKLTITKIVSVAISGVKLLGTEF